MGNFGICNFSSCYGDIWARHCVEPLPLIKWFYHDPISATRKSSSGQVMGRSSIGNCRLRVSLSQPPLPRDSDYLRPLRNHLLVQDL